MADKRKSYPSDVNDDEWAFCVQHLTLMTEEAPQRDYPLREPVEAEGGWVTLSESAGLGIDLDEEMLARTKSTAATFD